MIDKTQLYAFVTKCKQSPAYFIQSCCKVKHSNAGILPFKLFSYQKHSLDMFTQNRFVLFKKCRHLGISTLSGAYALWTAMMFSDKTILIMSKRDLDAKEFLAKHIKFIYDYLPPWMHDIWQLSKVNEHEIGFNNGSIIRSLTTSKNTLRANASSLNIIDEAAFIPDMDHVWASGWSTITHGGRVIVISTPCGVGNWYWGEWVNAKEGLGVFSPIEINWWDMDWILSWKDKMTGKTIRIAPRDDIRECMAKEELEKYGPYWSPWLENEYKALASKGESHLFKQELLGEFIGSGGTVLSSLAIKTAGKHVKEVDTPRTSTQPITYNHPITGDKIELDMRGIDDTEGLWVWQEPIKGTPPKLQNGKLVGGNKGHKYTIGIDVSTGKNNDYSAISIWDIDGMAQVAEYMGRVQLKMLAYIIDYLGRYYNNAIVCVERNSYGEGVIQDIENSLMYPNLWRKKIGAQTGFYTSEASKPTINKALITYIAEDEEAGYKVRSDRLWKQLQLYIRQRTATGYDTNKTGAQPGRGNFDDLVIAAGLAFVAASDFSDNDPMALIPANTKTMNMLPGISADIGPAKEEQLKALSISSNDPNVLPPLSSNIMDFQMDKQETVEAELAKFSKQLISSNQTIPISKIRKHTIKAPR